MTADRLPPQHLLLALAVVAVWGTNFVVIKTALEVMPPLLLATLRVGLAFALAGLFVRRPAVAWLLARHPAATVTPMALLVPVFGIGASALLLAEPLPAWKLGAVALVMAGLALNLLWPRLSR